MKRMVFLLAILVMALSCAQQESQSLSDAVNQVIMSRRSIRQYKPVTVGRDTLDDSQGGHQCSQRDEQAVVGNQGCGQSGSARAVQGGHEGGQLRQQDGRGVLQGCTGNGFHCQ